jgi:hypothetical protein
MIETTKAGYLEQGPFTEAGEGRGLLEALVRQAGPDPRAIAEAIRGLDIHVFWRGAYGVPEAPERSRDETNLRRLSERLAAIGEANAAIGRERDSVLALPPERRVIANCRDLSLFFAAALREAGIPARARCGFGMYFMPDHGEDHWVVERWDEASSRWLISDPQLDDLMIHRLKPAFDPMDLPDGAFLSGGEAWLACRNGDDPRRYGIFDMSGWEFVMGDFVRDLAALACLELLPWDLWGLMEKSFAELTAEDLAALDAAARASPMRAPLTRAEATRLLADPRFALPRKIHSYVDGRAVDVDLGPILGSDWLPA